MPRFLIDLNLPRYFSIWHGPDFVHQSELGDQWTDTQIWNYAREHGLTIVTKDADFSERVLLQERPPSVIHIRFGNLRMSEFHRRLTAVWETVARLSTTHSLVQVFADRVEAVE